MSDIEEMKVLRVSARAHAALKLLAETEQRTMTAQANIIIELAAERLKRRLAAEKAEKSEVAQ